MENSIVELILKIKKRPAMYLGRNSISCLRSFIDGWNHRDASSVSDAEIIGEFQSWVEYKYKLKNAHSWDRIILFYSQDEGTALKNFFELFDEFLIQREEE